MDPRQLDPFISKLLPPLKCNNFILRKLCLHGTIRLFLRVPHPPAQPAIQGFINSPNYLLRFLSYSGILNTVGHFKCVQVPENMAKANKNFITVRLRQKLTSPGGSELSLISILKIRCKTNTFFLSRVVCFSKAPGILSERDS